MRRVISLLVIALIVLLVAGRLQIPRAAPLAAATEVSSGAINAGCYLATPSVCKLRVEPFTLQTFFGARLEAVQLQANGSTIYDFRTDVSNPPSGAYTPSRVKLDFAATCGRTYVVSVQADDTLQTGFATLAQTSVFSCPLGRSEVYVPLVTR